MQTEVNSSVHATERASSAPTLAVRQQQVASSQALAANPKVCAEHDAARCGRM